MRPSLCAFFSALDRTLNKCVTVCSSPILQRELESAEISDRQEEEAVRHFGEFSSGSALSQPQQHILPTSLDDPPFDPSTPAPEALDLLGELEQADRDVVRDTTKHADAVRLDEEIDDFGEPSETLTPDSFDLVVELDRVDQEASEVSSASEVDVVIETIPDEFV